MKIVAGLGNPGSRYETTRHNVGFLAVDRLIDSWKADGPASGYEGEIFSCSVAGEKVLLVKPRTYMNESGRCIGPLTKFYKCVPSDLIVIHDDLDLKPFALRIKTGGGTGGHNGLKSIDAHLGSSNTGYHRIRIGIGHPARNAEQSPSRRMMSPVDYVLQTFPDEELGQLDSLFDKVVLACGKIIRGDVSGAMNEFNRESN